MSIPRAYLEDYKRLGRRYWHDSEQLDRLTHGCEYVRGTYAAPKLWKFSARKPTPPSYHRRDSAHAAQFAAHGARYWHHVMGS